jgi:hypothetical protein
MSSWNLAKMEKGGFGKQQSSIAMLLAAQASGKKINFFINDNYTKCEGQFVHLTSQ